MAWHTIITPITKTIICVISATTTTRQSNGIVSLRCR